MLSEIIFDVGGVNCARYIRPFSNTTDSKLFANRDAATPALEAAELKSWRLSSWSSSVRSMTFLDSASCVCAIISCGMHG